MFKVLVVVVFISQVLAQECGICPPGPCQPRAECMVPQDPRNPIKIRHLDCGKFYLCDGSGNACEMSCPAGLHWSDKHNRCEWPWVACCDPTIDCKCPDQCVPGPAPVTTTQASITSTSTTASTPAPITPVPTPTPSSTASPTMGPTPVSTTAATPAPGTPTLAPTSSPTWAPTTPNPCYQCATNCVDDPRCPPSENPMNPTHLPHESDCSRFYKCSNGQRCLMQCRAGEHFSQALQRCEWPNYACCDRTIPCQSFPSPTDPCFPDGCPAPLNCRPDVGCPLTDNPLNPIHMRNPASCTSFYKCVEGQACLIYCPAGQHWSNLLQRCEWPNIACCDSSVQCCAQCAANRRQELNRLFGIKEYV